MKKLLFPAALAVLLLPMTGASNTYWRLLEKPLSIA